MIKGLFLAFALVALPALAQTTGAGAGGTQQTNADSTSESQATNNGNTQMITFTSPETSTSSSTVNYTGGTTSRVISSGTTTVKNVPSVSGPPLTSSNDTCMGSVSGSVNFAGFGAGVGSTVVDKNCVMLKNSREMWNMGMKAAALARLCMDEDNKEALEVTGFQCPARKQEQVQKEKEQQITDPYVRERLGLPPLK
jgi:hypothetical protein